MSGLFDEEMSVCEALGDSAPTLLMGGDNPSSDGLFSIQTAGATGAVIPEGADTMKACFHSKSLGQETPSSSAERGQRLNFTQQYKIGNQQP